MRCLELIRRAKLLTEVCKHYLIELHVVVDQACVCVCVCDHETVGKNLFSLYLVIKLQRPYDNMALNAIMIASVLCTIVIGIVKILPRL